MKKAKNKPNRATLPVSFGLMVGGVMLVLAFFLVNLPPRAEATIAPDEALSRLQGGENIILLDVRTKSEHVELRIPGSTLIPLNELRERAHEGLPDHDAVIFIYCRSGNRSATASRILRNAGYTAVYDLGGIIDWPYATESGSLE